MNDLKMNSITCDHPKMEILKDSKGRPAWTKCPKCNTTWKLSTAFNTSLVYPC